MILIEMLRVGVSLKKKKKKGKKTLLGGIWNKVYKQTR